MDNQRAENAEAALLSCLLCANHTWDAVTDLVSELDFSRGVYRALYATISDLASKSEPFDAVTVAHALDCAGKLDTIGGVGTIANLVDTFASAANVAHYARLVREQSVLRQVAQACDEIAEDARTGEDAPDVILGRAQQRVGEIAEQAQRGGGALSLRQVMSATLAYIDEASSREGTMVGVSTGYADLDNLTSGLCPQDLIIVAARPSMGKTALALNFAECVAIDQGRPAAFFSLEMSTEAVGLRVMSSRARVDLSRLRSGTIDDSEGMRVTTASMRMKDSPLFVDDAPALTVADIAARSRRLARAHGGLSLIVVDYIQLIAGRGKSENRNVEVMKISQELKALAKSLKVPVVALSQLNRGVEQRQNKRPMMSDLRDSGGIEQDADLIVFLYRDDYYNQDSPDRGTAEIIIAKQRNGPTGMARLAFTNAFCRFDALAHGWQPDRQEHGPKHRRGKSADYDY
ncbi:MAG: replicative DNA helicase [Sphingobacteriia bacterium]|nr:replicative DNA helicase [Sphingobacteriia bacterium]